jgi:predicted amidohydrolase YtcJ
VSPEWLFYNGNVVPMTGPTVRHTAFAVADGRVIATGSDSDLRPLISTAHTAVDLRGATVLPGLIDTHVHLVRTGLAMLGPSLPAAHTVHELAANVEQAVREFPGDLPLMCHTTWTR